MVIGEPQNAFGKRHARQDVEVVRVHIVLVHSDADSEVGAQAFVEPDLPSAAAAARQLAPRDDDRSEEHTSELQSLMRISYAVFCSKKQSNLRASYATVSDHDT